MAAPPGSIHEAVDRKRLLVAEQFGELRRAVLTDELVVLGYFAARRQRAALFRHAFEVAPELDFFSEQRIARTPIFVAFVRKAYVILLHHF